MKTPVWVWDKKQKKYLTLPKGIERFADGSWGYDMVDYLDDRKISDFWEQHQYLFTVTTTADSIYWKIVLKNTTAGNRPRSPR